MSEYLKKLLGYNKKNMTSRVTERRIKAMHKSMKRYEKPEEKSKEQEIEEKFRKLYQGKAVVFDPGFEVHRFDYGSCSSACVVNVNRLGGTNRDYDFINSSSASF